MLSHPTLHALHTLKLIGMAEALEQQLQQPDLQALSFEERLSLLVDREVLSRDNRRLTRLLQTAKLKVNACVEDIDYRHPRGLKRAQLTPLLTGEWLRTHQNLCFTGATGTGKTWLACAFGQLACRLGFSVRYLRLPRLFEQLRIAHGDGSYLRLLQLWAKTDLLILDDWGLDTLTPPERKDLLELMEDRHGLHSTLITSQLPLEHWHTYLGDPTMADAILDRLLHNAHKIHLKGESMRKTSTSLTQRDHSE
jgi:DNA replication protein DnaC